MMLGKLFKLTIPTIIVALLVIGGYFYWQQQKRYPTTDDAYVQANVVNIAPRVNGKVAMIYVQDHQHVAKGQLLFQLDQEPYKIALTKARAALDTAVLQYNAANLAIKAAKANVTQDEAVLVDIRAETQRTLTLAKKDYVSQSEADLAVKNLRVAQARLKSARSQLAQAIQKRGAIGAQNARLREAQTAVAQARLNLQYTRIVAPACGYIANFELRRGDVVNAFQPLFALIEDQAWWAQANYKETQLARIQPGQSARIKIDMYPGQVFAGKVMSISDGSGTSFSLLPPENASGNWVKVTQRFPVKVLITQHNTRYPLRLGASCKVTIDTAQPAL